MGGDEVDAEGLEAAACGVRAGSADPLPEAPGGLGVLKEVGSEVSVERLAVDVARADLVGGGVSELGGRVSRWRSSGGKEPLHSNAGGKVSSL